MRKRRIPSKARVSDAINYILSRRLKVGSQEELARLVLRELAKDEKSYAITPLRARRIALSIRGIEVKAKTRKSVGLKSIETCPICEGGIRPFRVKNLLGRGIVVGYECTSCGYESDLEAFIPMKYSFVRKGLI